ncbi:MAG: hypothetical protein H0U71_07060 [Gammaproteobacteria bacterium]|nr:hypothetical protein [Gammaproteobacteria bacterium]
MLEKRLKSVRQGSSFFCLGTLFTFFSGRSSLYTGNFFAAFAPCYNFGEGRFDDAFMNLIAIFATNLLGYYLEGGLNEEDAYKVSSLIIIAMTSYLIKEEETPQLNQKYY